jgi:hypothetical protein
VNESHAYQLVAQLLFFGVIPNGARIWVPFQHDAYCKTLQTFSALDCRCNVEVCVGDETYSFDDYVVRAGCVQ